MKSAGRPITRSAFAFLLVAVFAAGAVAGQVFRDGHAALAGGAQNVPVKSVAPITHTGIREADASCAVPVQTDDGVVCGVSSDGWREYLGIPYAAPPTGALRWEAPQPAAPWTTPYQAVQPGPHCISNNLDAAPAPSEDCLWLSVYVPPGTTPSSRLPVMVWIHGGAFQFDDDSANGIGVGTGSGQQLADTEHVIVVRMEYRMGALGFLASDALGSDPGNYGLEDQHAALEWVQHNVPAFGGDPGNVTLFGQSAGATSICLQLLSPSSAGLFRRAILESGWYQVSFSAASCAQTLPTVAQAQAAAQTLQSRAGCTTGDIMACLRQVPANTLLADSSGLNFTPVVDGHVVPAQPQTAIARGQFDRVPVIVGVGRNEGLPTSVSTWSGFTDMVQADYGADAGRVLAAYPQDQYASAAVAGGAVVSDQMICSAVTAATYFARYVPTYMYRWDDVTEPFYFTTTNSGNILDGAYHSAELTALFPGWALPPAQLLNTPDQTAISFTSMTYWGSFAADGSPSGAGVMPWPSFQQGGSVMSLQASYDTEVLNAVTLRQTSRCGLWDSIPT
jgi:para-nitrobenzyl esterase